MIPSSFDYDSSLDPNGSSSAIWSDAGTQLTQSTAGAAEDSMPLFGNMFMCVGAVGDFLHEETIEFQDDLRDDYIENDPRSTDSQRWSLGRGEVDDDDDDDDDSVSINLADSNMQITVSGSCSVSTDISSSSSELAPASSSSASASASSRSSEEDPRKTWRRATGRMNSSGTFDGECASPVVSFTKYMSSRSLTKPIRRGIPVLVPTKSWEIEHRLSAVGSWWDEPAFDEKINEPDVPTRDFSSSVDRNKWRPVRRDLNRSLSNMELTRVLSDAETKKSSRGHKVWKKIKGLRSIGRKAKKLANYS